MRPRREDYPHVPAFLWDSLEEASYRNHPNYHCIALGYLMAMVGDVKHHKTLEEAKASAASTLKAAQQIQEFGSAAFHAYLKEIYPKAECAEVEEVAHVA